MNVQTITLNRFDASQKIEQYRRALKVSFNRTDAALVKVYRALAKGRRLLDINTVIPAAGLNAQGLPKLAIVRADQTVCWYIHQPQGKHYRLHRDRIRLSDNLNVLEAHTGHYFDFPIRSFPSGLSERSAKAIVPLIPPQHRPVDALENYHILWEADWVQAPVDPILLKQIDGGIFAVIAAWDLTDAERMVLQSISRSPR